MKLNHPFCDSSSRLNDCASCDRNRQSSVYNRELKQECLHVRKYVQQNKNPSQHKKKHTSRSKMDFVKTRR